MTEKTSKKKHKPKKEKGEKRADCARFFRPFSFLFNFIAEFAKKLKWLPRPLSPQIKSTQ